MGIFHILTFCDEMLPWMNEIWIKITSQVIIIAKLLFHIVHKHSQEIANSLRVTFHVGDTTLAFYN